MKCLRKYAWVKLERNRLPEGKGILGSWMKLASRAAFRKGKASYCGHINDISVGMWAGGVVGVKSILGARNRSEALQTLDKLSALGYVDYELNTKTKKLTYRMKDWVIECSGAECMDGTVYTTEGYGFLCVPRNLTNRLVEQNYIFEEADAFLDLWCHTIFADPDNAFSFLYPIVQYGKQEAALTLETLGQRWKWEKTKVWRFFKKYNDVFEVKRLPGSYGCLVFNKIYPIGEELDMPNQEKIIRILNEIRILGRYTQKKGTDHEHINKLIAWFSRKVIEKYAMAEDEYSVVGDYRGKDMVGIISVNDWYVLDFGLENAEESESSGSQSHYGNTGELNYQSHILKEQGIAEMNITLPDSYQLKLNVIRNHLCQPCLEKVLESLEYNKWKTEEKEAIPLCLIDFKTLEVYSIQEISHKYIFERCYVKIDNDKNQSSILVARY